MDNSYPFTWTENEKDDREKRSQFWRSPKAISVHQMISNPMSVNMPKYFTDGGMHKRIWNLKPRSDDLWIVTYPKSGTTMASEMLWQLSTGCDVESKESKRKLGLRCPFIEYSCLRSSTSDIKRNSFTFENEEKEKEHEK